MKDKIRLDSASWGFAELEKYVVSGWWSGGGGRQILVRSLEPNIIDAIVQTAFTFYIS